MNDTFLQTLFDVVIFKVFICYSPTDRTKIITHTSNLLLLK